MSGSGDMALAVSIEDLLSHLGRELGSSGPPSRDLRSLTGLALMAPEVRGSITRWIAARLPTLPVPPAPSGELPVDENTADLAAIRIRVTESFPKYYLIGVRAEYRREFPGYEVPFTLETDIGAFGAKVTSARKGTPPGHTTAGSIIKSVRQGDLTRWYRHHPEVQVGGFLVVEVVEPMVRYRLAVG